MAEAEVGDDVFGEDPTARRLEERVAAMLGKSDALFVPSGTMANQLSILIHTDPGDEVIVDRQSHIFNYESGAAGVVAGVQLHVVDSQNGLMTPEQLQAALRPGHYWETPSRLLCLENTVNKAGGVLYSYDQLEAVTQAARARQLATHLDGARLWNASVCSGRPLQDYGELFDTVFVALSKGLGAPVGSVLAGSREQMKAARRYRKMLGGGMRQIGVLAAAGLYAIEHHRDALAHDHEKARTLAEAIAEIDAFEISLSEVHSNIVMFDVVSESAAALIDEAKSHGVLLVPFGPTTIRATTHRDVSMDEIYTAISALSALA